MAKTELTKDERLDLSKSIYDKAKSMGLSVEHNPSNLGGLLTIGSDIKNKAASHIEWQVNKSGDVHMAGTLPSNTSSGYNLLVDAKDYESDTIERKDKILLSRKAVRYEGIVASAIEALVEVPTLGGWYINCKDEDLRKLCYYWAKWFNSMGDNGAINSDETRVQTVGGIELFSMHCLWQLYQDGDSVVTESWEHAVVPELGGKRFNLPVRYIDHDVAECEIPEALAAMGIEVITVEMDSDLQAVVQGSGDLDDNQKLLLKTIPPEMLKKMKESGETKFILPSEFTTHFSRKNNERDAWGNPFTIKAFPSLAFKHRLRALDNATIDGLIQRVWIVKLGMENEQHPLAVPDDSRVLLAVSAFRQLQTQNFLIWGGQDLTTEEFGSSQNNILSLNDRYQQADRDILASLAVPRVLIDGEGVGKGIESYAKTIAQMERYQIMIGRWIEHKLRQIAEENNFKDEFPTFHWNFLKMSDQQKAKNIVNKMYENGGLGIRAYLNMSGVAADEVIKEAQEEKESGLKDTLPLPNIPFTKQDDREGVPDGDGDNPDSKKPDPDSNRDTE